MKQSIKAMACDLPKNPAKFEIPLLKGKKGERKEEMATSSHISGYSLLDYKHSNYPRVSSRFCFSPLNNMSFIIEFSPC